MIESVIVDNDPDAIAVLRTLLESSYPDFHIAKTFTNPIDAIHQLPVQQPQVAFLDIEMPGINGLDVLRSLQGLPFKCVFVTGHEHYAMKAIELNAFDYLLKPLDPVQLERVVFKLRAALASEKGNDRHSRTMELSSVPVILPTGKGWRMLNTSQMVSAKADGNYCQIQIDGEPPLIVTRLLKDLHAQLPDDQFIRVHKSFIINRAHLREYLKTDGGILIMSDLSQVPVSRTYQKQVEALFT